MKEVYSALEYAIRKHPIFPYDVVHMVAIMEEEAGEAMRAALQYYYEGGNIKDLKEELLQTAAMCLRCLNNIKDLPEIKPLDPSIKIGVHREALLPG